MLSETLAFGGRLKNKQELLKSSSGGAFTAFSDAFLDMGYAVVCASYNYDNHQQEFRLITSRKERDNARGSVYVQSILNDSFREANSWINDNPEKKLIFFGMGCQAAGFQSYAEKMGFRDRTTIVDIICHGSPSPKLWKDYVMSIEKEHGKVSVLAFRDKRYGWMNPTAYLIINGKEISIKKYTKLFYSGNALRLSCHKCPYSTTKRNTDITIGDFWHIEDKIPEQYDENGTSLILVHSHKGKELFDKVTSSMNWFEANVDDCWQMNLERPTDISEERSNFWADYDAKGIKYIINKYGEERMIIKIIQKVRRLFNKWGGYKLR